MRLEDMKNEIPETPDFIHEMIKNEVEKQLKETSIPSIPVEKIRKWTTARVAAAVAVCVLGTTTAAYGGIKLYHMYLEKDGTYRVKTGITTEKDSKGFDLPDQIPEIEIQANYIPDGMAWMDEYHLEYPENNRTGGFSLSSVLLDNDDFEQVMTDTGVVESQERTFGDLDGVYLRYQDLKQDGSFNQRIYLLCPEEYRVITIYIGDDVSREEAFKFAENLEIVETETMIETAGLYTWSELVSPEADAASDIISELSDEKLKIHEIGDSYYLSASAKDTDGNSITADQISVCVDSIQIADDLQLLDGKELPEEWQNVVGADGKLVPNHLSYIKSGDGIDTLDEVVKTETVNQKLVYATVTYTNHSDQEIHHMLYLGSMMFLKQEGNNYQIYDKSESGGENYDRVTGDSTAHRREMTYYSIKEDYGNGGNYIPSLKPGESVRADMAWIVNENDLDYLYLNLCGDGALFEFSKSVIETGVTRVAKE